MALKSNCFGADEVFCFDSFFGADLLTAPETGLVRPPPMLYRLEVLILGVWWSPTVATCWLFSSRLRP